MNLKSLAHRELSEGMTKKELASLIRVPVRTLSKILADQDPQDSAIWEKFARYFRMDVEVLRTGDPAYLGTAHGLPGSGRYSAAGHIRKIPLLNWHQLNQLVSSKLSPDAIGPEAMVEATDVSGERTIALKVQDDSMEPLFSKGEIIFVNPEGPWVPGDYVIAPGEDGPSRGAMLRQLKSIGAHCMLHPLNRKYEDLPLTKEEVWGKVVRLRKNL
ncbi:MAG: putative bacteriophage-related transcriptional repressor [Nitrospira sp.]|jgi:SOS-response transcriptional repressor LexA|nr:putative bacteriophage-related transcriptional repressor [Nitrospira sp.]